MAHRSENVITAISGANQSMNNTKLIKDSTESSPRVIEGISRSEFTQLFSKNREKLNRTTRIQTAQMRGRRTSINSVNPPQTKHTR